MYSRASRRIASPWPLSAALRYQSAASRSFFITPAPSSSAAPQAFIASASPASAATRSELVVGPAAAAVKALVATSMSSAQSDRIGLCVRDMIDLDPQRSVTQKLA